MAATAEELAKQKAQARFEEHNFTGACNEIIASTDLKLLSDKYQDNAVVFTLLLKAQNAIEGTNLLYRNEPAKAMRIAIARKKLAAFEIKQELIIAALAKLEAMHLVIAEPQEHSEYQQMLQAELIKTSENARRFLVSYEAIVEGAAGWFGRYSAGYIANSTTSGFKVFKVEPEFAALLQTGSNAMSGLPADIPLRETESSNTNPKLKLTP